MLSALRELYQYRELLIILVQRDLKVRYRNSILGFGWSLLNPLIQVATITFVIKFMMGSQAPNYHVYVFCASLPWLFFNTGIMDATISLVFYYRLIRRVYFPRELVPIAAVVGNLVHLGLSFLVFLVYVTLTTLFWWATTGRFDWPILWSVLLTPIPILGMLLLVTGISLVVSVWTLNYQDVRFVLDSGLRIFYWAVPVLYSAEMLEHRDFQDNGLFWYVVYMLNPVSAFISAFRKLTLVPGIMPQDQIPVRPMDALDWCFVAVGMLVSLLVAMLGYRYFRSQASRLAERV